MWDWDWHILVSVYMCTQSCPTLCDPMEYSLPGSSAHGILQARILEWVAITCSRGSSWQRDLTCISYITCIGMWILYHWATWEALTYTHFYIQYITNNNLLCSTEKSTQYSFMTYMGKESLKNNNKMSGGWMDRENVVHIYSGILSNH